MRFQASELFTLVQRPPVSGKPDWMTLHAAIRPGWRGEPAELTGPGVFGVFLDDALFYIGLYAGRALRPFGGSVLERWHKHATYHTLRSPYVEFRPAQLARILHTLTGPVGDGIAACLPDGRATAPARLDPETVPLAAAGPGSCTFRKARFAERHWDRIGPDQDAALLDRISFVYRQVPRDWADRLDVPASIPPSRWVKRHWLRDAETALIRHFRPICNAQTAPGDERSDASVAEVVAMMAELFAGPEAPAVVTVPSPAPAAEADEEEAAFFQQLSPAGAALVEVLENGCPATLSTGVTDKPDWRTYRTTPTRRVLVTLAPRKDGTLRGETLAGVAATRALGFDAEPLPGTGPLKTRFVIDPASDTASAVIAVAGAALVTLGE